MRKNRDNHTRLSFSIACRMMDRFFVTNMLFTFLVLCCAAYTTTGMNITIPDCDCVSPRNCSDVKRNPVRCPIGSFICCENITSRLRKTSVKVSSTTVSTLRSGTEESLFGSGAVEELTSQCGVATTRYNYELKELSNDGFAIENEFPWVLEIFQKEGSRLYPECGAVLTDYRVAVTSAHCVVDLKVEDIIVRAGDYDIQKDDERFKHQDSKVLKIIPHPQYNALGSHNNIALLMLEGFKKSPNISPICTPEPTDFSLNSRCYAAGWGSTDQDEVDPEEQQKMQKIRLKLLTGKQCTTKLRFTQLGEDFQLSNSSLCALSDDEDSRDTGLGFGGAPLFCMVEKTAKQKSHFSLLGITSWRVKGSSEAPGVYTAFPQFLNWTDNAIMDFFAESTS